MLLVWKWTELLITLLRNIGELPAQVLTRDFRRSSGVRAVYPIVKLYGKRHTASLAQSIYSSEKYKLTKMHSQNILGIAGGVFLMGPKSKNVKREVPSGDSCPIGPASKPPLP